MGLGSSDSMGPPKNANLQKLHEDQVQRTLVTGICLDKQGNLEKVHDLFGFCWKQVIRISYVYVYLDPPKIVKVQPPGLIFGGFLGPKCQTVGGFRVPIFFNTC